MTFSDLATTWLEALAASPETKRKYRRQFDRHILPIFGPIEVETITDTLISDWLKSQVLYHHGRSQLTAIATRMRDVLDSAVHKRHLKKHLFQRKTLTQVLRVHGYDGPASSRRTSTYITPDFIVPHGGTQLFEHFASDWMENHSNSRLVREERIDFMNRIWIPAFTGRRLDSIDRLDILAVVAARQKTIPPGECKRAISLLAACLHEAVATGCLTYNPAYSWSHCMNVPEADPGMDRKKAVYPQQRLAATKYKK